jgi:hypothetical protein
MTIKDCCRIALLALVASAAAEWGIAAEPFGYPPTISLDEVRQRVDKAPVQHPRLLADRKTLAGLRQAATADPLSGAVAEAIIREAKSLRNEEPAERRLQGRRLLGVSRQVVGRVLSLATAYHLTGDQRHADRCRQEMLAAARFSDWNPSHFLDVGEMTFALAIGYDWLFDRLSPAERQEIRKAIVEKGVRLPWETRHNGWVRVTNNWGQVCHGGITAGALAVMEDEPELAAKTVHSALHNVTRSMASYAPEGSYPEGPGYWSYGTSYNVILIALLESVFQSDFGLGGVPGFNQTGQYLNLVTGPSGLAFNYADGSASRSGEPAVFWLADRYKRPDWTLSHRELLQASMQRPGAERGGRFLPLLLLWMRPSSESVDIRMPLSWQSRSATPIAVHRSSWTDPQATFVGLKGGSPSASHGQMDIGSFVLDADGVRWAHDLGAEGYHGIESRGMDLWSRDQDSDRWTIFRQSNHGHNTLVIDGQLQKASADARIIDFSDDATEPYTVVDMSALYEGQAKSVVRQIRLFASREVLIEDRLAGLKPGSRIRWGMITKAEPDTLGRPALELREGNARLGLQALSPRQSAWQVIDTATPRQEWDSPNEGTRMVAFEAEAPPGGELRLSVLATPGSATESVRDRLQGNRSASPEKR